MCCMQSHLPCAWGPLFMQTKGHVAPVGLMEARAGATLTPTGPTLATLGATRMAEGAKLSPVTPIFAKLGLK